MKTCILLVAIVFLSGVSAFATNLRNDSGRWLQVDCYNGKNTAIGTMNMRANDNDPIPANAAKIVIRVNGKSIKVEGSQIVITRSETLKLEK